MFIRSKQTNRLVGRIKGRMPFSYLVIKPNGDEVECRSDYIYEDPNAEEEFRKLIVANDHKIHNGKIKEVIQNITDKKSIRNEYHLPGMPWLPNATREKMNEPDQNRSNERWLKSEDLKLLAFWNEIGYATAERWKGIAENEFGRSLYAIECELRYVIVEKYWNLYYNVGDE